MDTLKRGDVITVAGTGDFEKKPRAAIVIQSNLFNDTHSSVTVVPITTTLLDAPLFRIDLLPSSRNGLGSRSQAMADKVTSIRTDRVGARVGALPGTDMERIDAALRLWLSL